MIFRRGSNLNDACAMIEKNIGKNDPRLTLTSNFFVCHFSRKGRRSGMPNSNLLLSTIGLQDPTIEMLCKPCI